MAWSRRRFAVLACILGSATLVVGIGVASGAKLKTKSASTTIGPAGDTATATAKCKRNTQAVSGGWSSPLDLVSPGQTAVEVLTSRRLGKREWTNTGFNFGDQGGDFTTYAYCGNRKLKTKTNETSVAGGGAGAPAESVTARCKRGTKVISGGYESDVDLTLPNQTAIFPADSHKVGKRKWTVTGHSIGNQTGDLVAQANCGKGKAVKARTDEHEFAAGTISDADLEAKCERSESVVSGGFSLEAPNDSANAVSGSPRSESKASGRGSRRPLRQRVRASAPS